MSVDNVLLGDLGGTHLRLAWSGDKGPEQTAVYKTAEWPGIAEVLADYAKKTKSLATAECYLSHTGHVRDGSLTLDYKKNPWSFKLEDVREKFALKTVHDLNDVSAMAYAPLYDHRALFKCFREGPGMDDTDALIIGIGTGVGHAFLTESTAHVRETYGGHFPIAAVTDLQRALVDAIRPNLSAKRTFIFEDIVSGDGLFRLYQALGAIKGVQMRASSVFDLIAVKDKDPLVREAASLFCGFIGLYAHILASAAFAYGGVYLCGGVIERIAKAGLFDADAFITQFHQTMVPVVDHSLRATPLYVSENELIALYGLEVYAEKRT